MIDNVLARHTVVERVTEEVIKEVPARISEVAAAAAYLGFQYSHAPSLGGKTEALYKASPIALDLAMNASASVLLAGGEADGLARHAKDTLRARGIAVTQDSPYRLQVNLAALWATEVPHVVLFRLRLELTESVFVSRQEDVVKCPGSVWALDRLITASSVAVGESLKESIRGQIEVFCNDYLRAKDQQQNIQSRLPAIPGDFLSAPR